MGSVRMLLAATSLIALTGCDASMDAPVEEITAPNPWDSVLDTALAHFDRDGAPGCAVSLTMKGEILAAKAYGLANLDHNIPLTTTSVFRIASVSKQFTAMSLRLLAEDGALTLDDDIRKHLPELPEYAHTVTIRHLLNHSSGLPFYDDTRYADGPIPDYIREIDGEDSGYFTSVFMTDTDFLKAVTEVPTLHYAPGEKFAYNNTGYYLAGKIVERASGQHLRDFAKARIFEPLGMEATFFNTRPRLTVKNRATGYHALHDGSHVNWGTDLNWIGDGGVFTTVEDLAIWDGNFYHNILGGGAALIADMTTGNPDLDYGEDGADGYAYGLGIGTSEADFGTLSGHGGSWVGFRSRIARHPETGYGVSLLCNTDEAGRMTGSITRELLKQAVTGEAADAP